VEPLPRAAQILRPPPFAEGLQDRGDGRGALRGEVADEAAGAVQGGVELHEPVAEASADWGSWDVPRPWGWGAVGAVATDRSKKDLMARG